MRVVPKENIGKLKDCYGCGVCVAACPVGIVKLKENKDGFYSPVIDHQDKCVECGICLDVCAYYHDRPAQNNIDIKSFAGWCDDADIRHNCSSGGVGFALGKKLMEEGYKAVGVRYNPEKNRAEHFIAESVEEFIPSVGSKYIPSFSADVFESIDRKQKYFVTGTPCQIDSFRRYIRHFKVEDNFVLMDFFCHGVPSLLLWDSYIKGVEEKVGKISSVSWRNKATGWHDSWSMSVSGDRDTVSSRFTQGDIFYNFFLGNICLNRCCYKKCKYKAGTSSADIRIGDMWGKKYAVETEGVNAVVAFTSIGKRILAELSENSCSLVEEPFDLVIEGQMKRSPSEPWVRKKVLSRFSSGKSPEEIKNSWIRLYKLSMLPKKVVNKLCRIIHINPLFH